MLTSKLNVRGDLNIRISTSTYPWNSVKVDYQEIEIQRAKLEKDFNLKKCPICGGNLTTVCHFDPEGVRAVARCFNCRFGLFFYPKYPDRQQAQDEIRRHKGRYIAEQL